MILAPEGWGIEKGSETTTLIGPEGDVRIAFVVVEPRGSVQETALAGWHAIDAGFASTAIREVAVPPPDGWDAMHQIVYDVPAREARMELAIVRQLGSQAFVNLVRGSTAGIGRRGAQINDAILSWKPEGLRQANLADAAVSWTEQHSAKLKEFLLASMVEAQIPGVAVAVVQGGRVVYADGFGVRALGEDGAVTPRTRFMIGSATKPLTTLMMAKLIEQKKLSWSTQVVALLPGFALADPEITRRLEVRHTASASTGMPRQDTEFLFRYSGITAEDRIAQMKTMQPTTGFGETFQYSNPLVAAGGFAAARAFRADLGLADAYDAAMTENVFRPLGMADSCMRQEEALRGEAAMPHAMNFESGMSRLPLHMEMAVHSMGPAGGAWSTVLDLARYLLLELGKGTMPEGERVIAEEFLLERRKPGIKIGKDSSYGLGLFVSDDSGLRVIHHAGNTLGFSSDLFFLPEKDLGVVVLTNAYAANVFVAAVRQKVFEIACGAEAKAEKTIAAGVKMRPEGLALLRKRVTRDAASMEWVNELAGTYRCPELGSGKLQRRGDGFWMQFEEWGSEVGCEVEAGGDRLLRLLSPPWCGGLKLLVHAEGGGLTLDQGQNKYVFQRVQAQASR